MEVISCTHIRYRQNIDLKAGDRLNVNAMTDDQDEGSVTVGEFHDLADSNLASALLAQGMDPVDPSAGVRELSLSQYALLSIATSLREIATLQSELNNALGLLAGRSAQSVDGASRGGVSRKRR